MKRPTSVSLDPEQWEKFMGKTGAEGRKASPVLQVLIDGYLKGSISPYHNGIDWAEQARIAFALEQLR